MNNVNLILTGNLNTKILLSIFSLGALVKTDEQEVINFLLTTEIIPLCLRIMESGSELSKTVCAFNLIRLYIVLAFELLLYGV